MPDIRATAESLDQLVTLLIRLLPRENLSLTAASTLATLSDEGPMRITDLAARQGVSQPGMTGVVARLGEQGLVERTPDEQDRRSVLVSITAAGRQVREERRRSRTDALAALVAALDADDLAVLAAAAPAVDRLAALVPTRPTPAGAPA